ncbi:MAG: efflux RND transporter periplasmic adaptor subunit [Streptosporangiaceae bacterium]
MTGKPDDQSERWSEPRRSYQPQADYSSEAPWSRPRVSYPARQPRQPLDQAPGRYQAGPGPYAPTIAQPYGNSVQRPYAEPADYPIPQRSGQANGAQRSGQANGLATPAPLASRQVSRQSPATASVSLQPAHQFRGHRQEQVWTRRQRTWPQRIGGLLIAGACVAAVAWYVPQVMRDDRQLFTGTVTSSGIITLNFTASGEIGKLSVHLDQKVRKGQVLAVEYAPSVDSVVAADKAAIAAEQAKLAELKAAEASDPAAAPDDKAQLGAEQAQLALDQAQLDTDQAKRTATEIIAPAAGTVIAANGQPGETVTSAGIRNYLADSAPAQTNQNPAFSLFTEGPQTVHRTSASQSALPVVALRVSASWQVVTLVPESSISRIKEGADVTISVPAGRITAVPGQVSEILPTPTSTSAGTFYQVVITITGHPASLPLNGMTADIRIGS